MADLLSPFSGSFSIVAAKPGCIPSSGEGVPTLVLAIDPSSITNSGSSEAGSGTLSEASPSLTSGALAPPALTAGEDVRDPGLLVAEWDLPGLACAALCLACSSAILESIAPFIRFQEISVEARGRFGIYLAWNPWNIADPAHRYRRGMPLLFGQHRRRRKRAHDGGWKYALAPRR
jgi:hypothetical protein